MGRGPSYPYVGLEDGIALTRKMYDYAKRAPAPVESIVTEAWKYSTTSSSGQKVLAALKSFGLVEDVPGSSGKSLKITARAVRLLLDSEDSQDRKEELKRAALAPRWYEFCWRTWGKEMPPSMRSNLMIEHGFVESTVDGFLRDYRKTIAFVGLLDDALFGKSADGKNDADWKPSIGDYVQWESQGILKMPEAKKVASFLDEGRFALVEGSNSPIPVSELISAEAPEQVSPPQNIFVPAMTRPSVPGEKNMQSETIALAGGVTLQVQWPSAISEDAYDDFLYQLEGFKRRIGRAVQKSGVANVETDSTS